jgi:hypothetical protein
MSHGNSMLKTFMQNIFIVCCLSFLSSSWIVIGFGLDCQSILKSGLDLDFQSYFLLDLDWIEQKPVSMV